MVTIIALCGWTGTRVQTAQRTLQEQNSYRKAMEDADQKIVTAEDQHSEVMANEEYLTTFIGPRLTGSAGMQRASEWTLSMFQRYGVDAHLETCEIAHAWTRGNDWGELVSPVEHWMTVRSAAWSKATNGPISGPLAIVDATTTPEEIATNASKFKNAIVLSGEEAGGPLLPENPPNAYNAVVPCRTACRRVGRQGFRERFGATPPGRRCADEGRRRRDAARQPEAGRHASDRRRELPVLRAVSPAHRLRLTSRLPMAAPPREGGPGHFSRQPGRHVQRRAGPRVDHGRADQGQRASGRAGDRRRCTSDSWDSAKAPSTTARGPWRRSRRRGC